jgi:hypothetical protein
VPLLVPPVLLAMTMAVVFTELRGPLAIIFVLGISAFPLVAVFSGRAFERIDARREEAKMTNTVRALLLATLAMIGMAACESGTSTNDRPGGDGRRRHAGDHGPRPGRRRPGAEGHDVRPPRRDADMRR